jgi:hypothetical protein
MVQNIIAITGRAGSGKSTAARYLADRYGYTIHSFATPLKAAIRAIGVPAEALTPERKELPLDMLCGQSPRQAMQSLGTEWGRTLIGYDFWVRSWMSTMPATDIVVDDLRFQNEAAQLKAMGATIVRIRRNSETVLQSQHISEVQQDLIQADAEIWNHTSPLHLTNQLDGLMQDLRYAKTSFGHP